MGTTIRPEISTKNPYWIEKHRYYELKHFCLQYPFWRKLYLSFDSISTRPFDIIGSSSENEFSDPTARCAIDRAFYSERMNMLNRVAETTDRQLADYILNAVTVGWSYDILKARLGIPCGKDTYYELYRKFFYLLDKERR